MNVLGIIVLKPGPVRRADPGPGRLGPGTGPSLSKNPLGSWPGETRSTRYPGKPDWDPASFFFFFLIYMDVKPRRFGLSFSISTFSQKPNWGYQRAEDFKVNHLIKNIFAPTEKNCKALKFQFKENKKKKKS